MRRAQLLLGHTLPKRLVRDYERLPDTLKGLHFAAFACLMLNKVGVSNFVDWYLDYYRVGAL